MTTSSPKSVPDPDQIEERETKALQGLAAAQKRLRAEIRKVIVGQDEVIDQLFISLFSRGHCLLVGVPGLAKTLLVSTLAKVLDLSFKRIQFTPDLMPSDITGTDVLQDDPDTGKRTFRFIKGPLFTNVLLADEINRTPPKTQAALLEAMQEKHVTVGLHSYSLPHPFFVLATQNPIEQEGTYPLPEAQLDRFMLQIQVKYPSAAEELMILKQTTRGKEHDLQNALTGEQVTTLQEVVQKIPVPEHVYVYARDLVRSTRPDEKEASSFIKQYLSWGAGPRAGQYLVMGAKAHAVIHGRFQVTTQDVKAIALPTLRHRIVTNFHADSDKIFIEDVVDHLLQSVKVEVKSDAEKLRKV